VMYPLERHGVKGRNAEEQARDMLRRLNLEEYAERLPRQLSGGQQQRVGLARALASGPELFLFDEPTANLDTALRQAFQAEIARQEGGYGVGGLYVTHDPAEAFIVADRVMILRAGKVMQIGTPIEVYDHPIDSWVARLTGPCSIMEGQLVEARATDGNV